MTEYRTAIVDAPEMLKTVLHVGGILKSRGLDAALVYFGWDSNLPVDDMWQPRSIPVDEIADYISSAERNVVVQLGKSDIFIESFEFLLTLCHEGDMHIVGESLSVQQVLQHWRGNGYEPVEVAQKST